MQATPPGSGERQRYDYASMTAEGVTRAAGDALEEAERLIRGVVEVTAPRTYDNTLRPLFEASRRIWRAEGVGTSIGYVHPDEAIRVTAAGVEERNDQWRSGLSRRDDLAAAIRAYAATEDARSLDGDRRRSLELWLRDVRRGGHELEPDDKAEFGRLRDRVSELGVAFGRNLAEWTDEIVLGPDDLDGLSDSFVAQLPDGEAAGSRRLTATSSAVFPFLEQSSRRDLREAALKMYHSRCAGINRPLIDEIVASRRRLARIVGVDSWSQLANEARMSGGRAAVMAFLDGLIGPLQKLAAPERAALEAQLRSDGHDGPLQAWDWSYYHERQRRELGVDVAELRAYFPLDTVLDGVSGILAEVFGVAIRAVPDAPVWHPEVLVYELRDVDSGELLADVYLDLFARDGKRPGGWQTPLELPVNEPGEPRRPAVIQLVLNFQPRATDGTALLQFDDVIGLLHEFGHVLEFGLSLAEGAPPTFDWIELDFVEAPSQIMEHWAWSPEVLRRIGRHHQTGEPPPAVLLERLPGVRRLNIGTYTLWYLMFRTLVDQYLHGPDEVDAADAYRRGFDVTGFPFPEGTFQPASFDHVLAGIYDAGMYSYLWAQVFGDDMFSAFRDGGLLSGEVGRRYRREVLEPSWTVPGRERVERFLGRPASDRAFLERLGIAPALD
jgi:Zn-dependent oligopeptidase